MARHRIPFHLLNSTESSAGNVLAADGTHPSVVFTLVPIAAGGSVSTRSTIPLVSIDGNGLWSRSTSSEIDRTRTQTCEACPVGAHCPGGSVLYPLAGYWSFEEETASGLRSGDCMSGRDGSIRVTSSSDPAWWWSFHRGVSDGIRIWRGFLCDMRRRILCGRFELRECGSQTAGSQQAEFVFKAIGMLILFGAMCLAVAFFDERRLALAVSALMGLQQFVLVGSTAMQTAAGSAGTELFNYLSILILVYRL